MFVDERNSMRVWAKSAKDQQDDSAGKVLAAKTNISEINPWDPYRGSRVLVYTDKHWRSQES